MAAQRATMTPGKLEDGMKLLGDNPVVSANAKGDKILATSADGTKQLTADGNFGYFRVQDLKTKQYLGLDGKPPRVPPGQNMTPERFNELTHFKVD